MHASTLYYNILVINIELIVPLYKNTACNEQICKALSVAQMDNVSSSEHALSKMGIIHTKILKKTTERMYNDEKITDGHGMTWREAG